MHVDDALERFTRQLRADGRSENTLRQYRRHICAFSTWARRVGHTGDLKDVSNETVAEFFGATEATTRPDGATKLQTSLNSLRGSIRGFFRYCHQAGHLREPVPW